MGKTLVEGPQGRVAGSRAETGGLAALCATSHVLSCDTPTLEMLPREKTAIKNARGTLTAASTRSSICCYPICSEFTFKTTWCHPTQT